MTTATVIDNPGAIEAYRRRVLLAALRLECKGLRRSRRPSVFQIVKSEYGLKGSKSAVLSAFEKLCDEKERELGIVHA